MSSISFKSVEKYDYISLLKILQNWDSLDLPSGAKESWTIGDLIYVPKTIIANYLKKSVFDKKTGIAEIPVTYKYSQIRKKQGRQFAVKSLGLQSFNKWFRHTICKDLYIDLDIENAHPKLLCQYCQKNKIDCSELLKYIENRDQYLNDLQTKHNFTRLEAKQCLLAVLNGAKRYSPVGWFDLFKKDISNIHQLILNMPENSSIVELVKKSKTKTNGYNIEGRVTNHILCQLEDDVLMTCIKYLQDNNYSTKNIVLCFDGFMIPKEALNPTKEFFDKLNDYVNQQTGYNLQFTSKPMDMILNLELFECDVDEFQNDCLDKGRIVEDDADAAEILLQHLEGSIFKSLDHIYIKTQHYQTWTSHPKQVDNELQLQCTNLDIKKVTGNGKIVSFSRNSSTCRQIVEKAKLLVLIDDSFANRLFHQSINKIFFLDGVYDFTQHNPKTNKYGVFRKENNLDLTPIRLNKKFPQRNEKHIEKVDEVISSIFKDEPTKITFLQNISRGIGGRYTDKSWSFLCGPRDCGKGVITDALIAAFDEYVKTFDANNLIYKKGFGGDEAKTKAWMLPLRWARLAFGNEINVSNDGEDSNAKLNGIIIKSTVSGGDKQIARDLYQSPIEFIFAARMFLCINEIPEIVPNDACETMTLFNLKNKFVDSLDGLSTSELKFMKLKDPNLKDKIRTEKFSNALIHIVLDHYIDNKVIECDSVKQDTVAHRIEQGNDYLFFKETFDITHLDADKVSTNELKKIIQWKNVKISDKRIKQILVDQYGLKNDTNIVYEGKRGRGYSGLKIKQSVKTEFNESQCKC